MSFDKLKEQILHQASERAQRIEDEFKAKKTEQEKRIQAAARALEQALIDRATAQAESQARQIKQASDLAGRAHVLSAKQRALGELAEKFTQQLLAWPADETRAMIEKLMASIPDQAAGEIIPGALQADVVKKVGQKYSFVVSDHVIPNEGGFIWRGARHEYNFLTSHLVQQLFSRQRARLARVLFS